MVNIMTPNLRVQQLNPLSDVDQFLLRQLATSVRLLQRRPDLLVLCHHQVVAALCDGELFLEVFLTVQCFIQVDLDILGQKTKL